MQTSSPQLFIVDHDGRIVHRLVWEDGQYRIAEADREEVIAATLVQQPEEHELPTAAPAMPQPDQDSPQTTVSPSPTAPAPSLPRTPQAETADALLRQLKGLYEPLQDAVIVAADGTVVAATSDVASAMMREVVSALMEFGTQASQALDMGTITEITSRDAQMLSILYPAANGMALGVTTASNGNLGMLSRSCQRTVQQLTTLP